MSMTAWIMVTMMTITNTHVSYGASTIYFENGRVTRWYNSTLNPLRARLASTPTNKTHFTVGSTKGEVAAIQGTPTTFTETRFNYGYSNVYFKEECTAIGNSDHPLNQDCECVSTNNGRM